MDFTKPIMIKHEPHDEWLDASYIWHNDKWVVVIKDTYDRPTIVRNNPDFIRNRPIKHRVLLALYSSGVARVIHNPFISDKNVEVREITWEAPHDPA